MRRRHSLVLRATMAIVALAAAPVVARSQEDSLAGITVHDGLIYSPGGPRSLELDLYLPTGASGPFPAIVLIPGEPANDSLRRQYRELARLVASRGEMASAIIAYRTIHEAAYPGAIDDARAAVRWLRSHATRYGFNPRKIGAAGDGFGGYVASMLGLDRRDSASAIQAIATVGAVADIESYAPPPDGYPYQFALFFRYPQAQRPALWRAASPIANARAGTVPFLMVHGARDNRIPLAHSAMLRDTLVSLGASAELVEIGDAGHGLLTDARVQTRVMRTVARFFSRALWAAPPGVTVDSNVIYSSASGRALRLDVFRPESRAGLRPAVVFVHGGGWLWGDKRDHWPTAAYLASQGFVTASVEYRLAREHAYPAALQDVREAVAWLRSNAARYGIDPDRIGAAGSSAGGHLVAMLGVVPDTARERTPAVRAVAAIAAPVDLALQHERDRFAPALFVGAGNPTERPERWREASPITHVNGRAAAFLFLHGTADGLVAIGEAREMADRLRAAGVTAEFHAAEGGPHDFFSEPQWRRAAVRRLEEFFRATLGR